MRYEKFEDLLHLALEMQARHGGISLEEIQELFSISRRTAMRMKDSVMRVFPQVDEMTADDRKKRWRIPGGVVGVLNPIMFPPPSEIAVGFALHIELSSAFDLSSARALAQSEVTGSSIGQDRNACKPNEMQAN